eukprot:365988-Chlamydomonas_euryale.AAC.14
MHSLTAQQHAQVDSAAACTGRQHGSMHRLTARQPASVGNAPHSRPPIVWQARQQRCALSPHPSPQPPNVTVPVPVTLAVFHAAILRDRPC